MLNDDTRSDVKNLFADPETLTTLSVDDLTLILSSLKRNGLIIGVSLGDVAELEDGQRPLSLFSKDDYETRKLMALISCAYARKDKALIDTVEVGTFSHYEHLLQTERKQVNEHITRVKSSIPVRPGWLQWLYEHERRFYTEQLDELALYERHLIKAIDDLSLMYDTLPYPAFSARVTLDELQKKRPACFHVKSNG